MGAKPITSSDRRQFLKLSLWAGTGLLVTVPLGSKASAPPTSASNRLNAYVRIGADGVVTLVMPKVEMGQGTFTALPMLVAEELEVGLDQIRTEHAPPLPAVYGIAGDQSTGGSTSVRDCWLPLRRAGATARTALVHAAAETWKVPAADCHAEHGEVIHAASGRRLGYGVLAARAAHLPAPKKVALKDPKDFRLIGRSTLRLDAPGKTDGSTVFGIDVRVPGMRYAALALSPVMGGRVGSMDVAAAKRVPGVRQVVEDQEIVAVVADHTYAARKGLEALGVRWNAGANGAVQQARLVADLDAAVKRPGAPARRVGDAAGAMKTARHVVEATYHQPFLAHATMEPMNCTVHWQKDRCEIWVGTQAPDRAVTKLADLGLKPEQITIHNHLIGGGFGRRLEVDGIVIAARVARHVTGPVQVIWSREEDVQHDTYRPYYVDHLQAGLDEHGNPIAWQHTIAGASATAFWYGAPLKNGVDDDAVESSSDPAYALTNLAVRYVQQDPQGLTISWWRGVGPTRSVFVVESFIDELAAAAGKDPVAYRRPLLKDARLRGVLDLVAAKSGWGSPLPKGRGRGISIQSAFGSYLAQVAEVEVLPDGSIRVARVVCALDCGLTVNPATVHAQLEGGVIFGVGAALTGEITVKDGRVEQSNFHDYTVLRMSDAPRVETHLVASTESPGGVGETGTACIAAAVCNAVFAATGRRIRTLPLQKALQA
jgi:isoquinoline 1-oxidoreductase beta subunit